MDVFVEKYQPELYDLWKMGIQVASPTTNELKIINRNDLIRKRKRPPSISTSTPTQQSAIVPHSLKQHASNDYENTRFKLECEAYLKSIKRQYEKFEFSLYTDTIQTKHQLDVRNFLLADSSKIEAFLDVANLKNSIDLIRKKQSNCSLAHNSLLKLSLNKLVDLYETWLVNYSSVKSEMEEEDECEINVVDPECLSLEDLTKGAFSNHLNSNASKVANMIESKLLNDELNSLNYEKNAQLQMKSCENSNIIYIKNFFYKIV